MARIAQGHSSDDVLGLECKYLLTTHRMSRSVPNLDSVVGACAFAAVVLLN